MIVADSDVLIDALQGRGHSTARVRRALEVGNLATTAISVFELLSGAGRAEQKAKIESLLAALHILPFDREAAQRSVETRLDLENRGETIGMGDYLIAGICLSRSLPLLTNNRQHFSRVTGLELAASDDQQD